MTIFLIGFMGCGKTTVGKKLAKKLKYDFIDLDEEIEKKEQCTISKIFVSKGEDYFRSLEHNLLLDLPNKSNVVISCGGGAPCYFNNMEMMNNAGYTVYVTMPAEALFSRLKQAKATRPLLQNMNDETLMKYIKDKLIERESIYRLAKISVNGINLNVDDLAALIIQTN
jgi:shikimate kinase